MACTKSSFIVPSLLLLLRHGGLLRGVVAEAEPAPKSQITSPPQLPPRLLRRQQLQSDCQFGRCGNTCLQQGAFCCNPAGAAIDFPNWICDTGACATSIRGANGIVDCYDPDNPQGMTRSCIDNTVTACPFSGSCYRCSADVPFCHWETYLASGSPTLSRFNCISTSRPDNTLYAATTPSVTAASLPTSSLTSPTTPSTHTTTKAIGKGPIIGIAIGSLALISLIACLGWFLVSRRKKLPHRHGPVYELPDAQQSISPSEIHTTQNVLPPQYQYAQPPPDVKKSGDGGGEVGDRPAIAELPARVQGPSELENNPVSALPQTSWLALDMQKSDSRESK
ncbi:MAG: hypothetical protein M1813_002129 [Trichoglossum hirsutum]|nr:MAG: hypothetical protein M1813_002129 [Trichoglossum hirsutum]